MAEQDNISTASSGDQPESVSSAEINYAVRSSELLKEAVMATSMSERTAKRAGTSSAQSPSRTKSTSDELLNTWLESVEFEPPVKRQKRERQKSMKSELIRLCRAYRVTDREMWRELTWVDDHEIADYHNANIHRFRFLETVDDAAKLALFSIKPLTWQERVEAVVIPEEHKLGAAHYAANFVALFQEKVDPLNWWLMICVVMSRLGNAHSKVRTIYLQGPASCGKSAIMRLLTSVYDSREIGRFGPQGSTSQFWLEDLVGKEVYCGDEAPGNPLNIQQYLLLLEGNAALKTEIKYGGKPSLRPKPVIVACNQDIYSACQAFARPVLDRCLPIRLTERCTRDVYPPAELLPYVLHAIYTRARAWDNERKQAVAVV